jgi:tRNA-splicing endonuclease subunit Sen54
VTLIPHIPYQYIIDITATIMADAITDEDAPLSSLHRHTNNEDNDPSDELQDFRFLAALTAGSDGHKIPKRGEKDFEPHGTKHQDAVLAASRQAMHDALNYTRVHAPKSNCRAWYFGEGVFDDHEDTTEPAEVMSDAIRGRGLDRDHVVMVESSRGTHYRTMGKTALGKADARIWLLPEEALYLVERGNIDLWWPARPLAAVRGQASQYGMGVADGEQEEDDGFPLSLEAAYALLIGDDEKKGKVSLDRYTVYANLKRTGYVVFRDRNLDPSYGSSNTLGSQKPSSFFTWLFGALFTEIPHEPAPYGPLIQPGLYRSYNKIYQQLSLIPRHIPAPEVADSLMLPRNPFCLVYDIWKPSRIPNFAKSNPGMPDFQIAVVSSRSTNVPSLTQLVSLLESSPWDPPKKEWTGLGNSYQRLRHGWRNVILAVVDQGVISYLRMSEAAFGEERLYDRFDGGGARGGKKGGSRGKERGRGRGSDTKRSAT